ncbi:MAG: methyltransferase domain-containing protein [bacterium]|nr:methyltransferase domain-containing protein [bacterium]
MTRSPIEHAKLIQREFTKQATAYAANPTIIDSDWAGRLVQAVQPTPDSRVLDIATGPGYVALAFATMVREVVGVDLTDAPLGIARKNQAERGVKNVSFESADARQLPLKDGSFDIVVCRLALHHFDSPQQVLSEMVRVCRPGGKIAVQDMIASEQADRADYYNHWERLRDASHTKALSVGQLVALYGEAQLEIENLRWEQRVQDVELWMRNTETPYDTARRIRHLIQQDAAQEISGTPIFHDDEGRLCFIHRMVTVVGRRKAAGSSVR